MSQQKELMQTERLVEEQEYILVSTFVPGVRQDREKGRISGTLFASSGRTGLSSSRPLVIRKKLLMYKNKIAI